MTHFVTDDASHVIRQMWGGCVCRLNEEKFTITHLHIYQNYSDTKLVENW